MPIKINDVKLTYNSKDPNAFDAINGVNFTIEDGDFIAIVGKTGSGKSTLIQTFNGLLLPNEGYVRVDDFIISGKKKLVKELLKKETKEVNKLNKKLFLLKKKVGIVFQFPEYQLFSETILKDVMFGPKNFGFKNEEAKQIAIESLNKVGIDESFYDKSPFELSGGEKRRVGIADIIAIQPDILVLDEPTVGLDSNGKEEIMNMVNEIHKLGKTIVVVTHNMDLVMNYCNKVFVLDNGKLVKETTPNELFNSSNLEEYSLEEPTLYKFKKLLKEKGFTADFNKIKNFDSLIEQISRGLKK